MEQPVPFGIPAIASISIAGLIATFLMSVFVLSFTRTSLLPLNPLIAVGTVVTKSRSEALKAGILLHTCVGLGAAFFYASILKITGFVTSFMPVAGAGLLGLIHGYVLSFLIVITLGENGKSPAIRSQGMMQAGVYLVAHIIFGLSLGFLFMMMPNSLR